MAPNRECVIFVGLPGSGKTTFYRERFATTHTHVSKDLWPNATGREKRQRKMIDEAVAAGASIVVDNTNPRVADRAPLISIARSHRARVVGYFFDVATRTAVARNAGRTGRSKVPNVAIFTVAKRLEPPSTAEGSDQLFRVEPDENESVRITALESSSQDQP